MKIRTLSTLAVMTFGLALLTFSGSAQAQTAGSCVSQFPTQYPPGSTILRVDKSSVVGGKPVTATGCGAANGIVFFTIGGVSVGSASTNGTGFYSTTLTIPCNFPIGDQVLKATGAANNSTTLTITGNVAACPGGATGSEVLGSNTGGGSGSGGSGSGGSGSGGTSGLTGNLVRTGSSSTKPLAAAGLGLVLIGGLAVVTARKRSSARLIAE